MTNVVGAFLIGIMAASQAGWSGAELIASSGNAGFLTNFLFNLGVGISISCWALVQKIAKPVLWIMVPLYVYSALVIGAWNGFVSDFDATRGQAIKYHKANAYTLDHMSERGRFLSCQDNRIELADDTKSVCAEVLRRGR